MKKDFYMGKKIWRMIGTWAARVLIAAILAISLPGCGYSGIDDYLDALGISVPEDYPDNPVYPNEELSLDPAFIITDDASVSYNTTELETVEDITSDYSVEGLSIETVEETGADKEDTQKREDVGITDESIETIKKQQEGLYAFERLTPSGKTLYAEILQILESEGKDVVVSTTSDEAIEQVFDYVLMDHPEIFYVDGYSYTNYTLGDTITKITFSGNYLYGLDEVKSRQTRINEYVNKCLAGAPSSEDDYYAIKYVYEYIIDNTDYDLNASDNQNICSVFLNGRSVCNGYAKAAQYILNKLGIECTLVTGTVDTNNSRGVRHAWNLVQCNNAFYYMDVTWGDSSFQTASGETADASKLPRINYAYLNVTSSDIAVNHKVSNLISMPECNSIADNYYVREGEYFTSSELALVADLFNRRYNDGSDNVTIKCATKQIYDSLFEELITGRKVFDYIQGDDKSQVSYTTFEEYGTIIFWL